MDKSDFEDADQSSIKVGDLSKNIWIENDKPKALVLFPLSLEALTPLAKDLPDDFTINLESFDNFAIPKNTFNKTLGTNEITLKRAGREWDCFKDISLLLEAAEKEFSKIRIPEVEILISNIIAGINLNPTFQDELRETLTYRYLVSRYITAPLIHSWVKTVKSEIEEYILQNPDERVKMVMLYRDAHIFHSFFSYELNRQKVFSDSNPLLFEYGDQKNVEVLNLNRNNFEHTLAHDYIRQQVGDAQTVFMIDTALLGTLIGPCAAAIPDIKLIVRFFQYTGKAAQAPNTILTNTSFTDPSLRINGQLTKKVVDLIEDSSIPQSTDSLGQTHFMNTSGDFIESGANKRIDALVNIFNDARTEAALAASALGYTGYMQTVTKSDNDKKRGEISHFVEADRTMDIDKLMAFAMYIRDKLTHFFPKGDKKRSTAKGNN